MNAGLVQRQFDLSVAAEEIVSLFYGRHVLPGFYEGNLLVSGSKKKILIRRYKRSSTAAKAYFQFLEKHKHVNLLEPLFHMDIGDETVIAYANHIDCSLEVFLNNADQEKLATPLDHRYQVAFLDVLVSIFRQLVDLVVFCHKNRIKIGKLSLDNIYLDLSGKNPRVFVILPHQEQQMKNQKCVYDDFSLDTPKHDLRNFGGLLNRVCSIMSLTRTNASEIFHLIDQIMNGDITSGEELLKHPAFILEEKKFPFLIDVYEHILTVNKGDFSGPQQQFPAPAILLSSSWRVYFRAVLKKIDKKFRKEYHIGQDLDGFLNYCTFLRNVVIHIGRTEKLLKQFGNAGRFLRYARNFYPDIFIDLVYITRHYQAKAHILTTLTAG